MSRIIEDKDGDHLQVLPDSDGMLNGVTIAVTMRDESGEKLTTHHAPDGPVDPLRLIEAIKAECELHEDDSPVVEGAVRQIHAGSFTVDGSGRLRTLDEEID